MSAITAPSLGQAEGTVLLVAGAVALLAVAYVVKKGPAGVGKAAAGAAAAVVTGAVDGTADAISGATGLPTTEQTQSDPAVGRWLIDNYGYVEASNWTTPGAMLKALWMDAGSGTPPPAGTAVATAHSATAALDARPIDYGTPTDNPYGW